MNYGILHNRRRDTKVANAGVQALLSDPRLRGIAQQMGLRPSDFGAEAQQLWNQLNDMATTDPKRYQEFIQEQLQDGPPVASDPPSNQATNDAASADASPIPSGGASRSAAQKKTLPRFFMPRAGFVIKCAVFHTIKCQRKETKLFLNCCAHEIVGRPMNPNNSKPVPEDTHAVPSTSNLQIPLLVGKPRELRDASGDGVSVVIDVVFHDWVLKRCAWDANFKREVLKLALHWVQQDAKVKLVAPTGKFIKSRYKGGVAVGTDIVTSKFYIDANGTASSNQTEKRAIGTPSELLKCMMTINEDEEEQFEEKIVIAAPPPAPIGSKKLQETGTNSSDSMPKGPVSLDLSKATKSSSGKVLIEEIEDDADTPSDNASATHAAAASPPSEDAKKSAQSTEPAGKKSQVVKRGFLNSSKKTLYPTGSSEGRKASAYVNLLHRSKVVDLRDKDAQIQAHQQQQQQCQAEVRSLLEHQESPIKSTAPASGEDDYGDFEFEQLCMEADPDLKPAGPRQPTLEGDATARELFGEGFNDLARLLAS